MNDQGVASFAKTRQTISARVLAESRRSYGAMVDESTLEAWVSAAISSLLTEQTRVTQFIPVLAMRDIRDRANRYASEAA